MISMINHIAMKKADTFYKKYREKMYGSTLVGARGQIVIPADARKDLHIKAGDRLVVMGKGKRALGLIKASEMASILSQIIIDLDAVDFEQAKQHAKKNVSAILEKLKGIKL